VLAPPDRRTPCGKRDYAILFLLATYGLRAREIVAMTLDGIDWKRARLPAVRGIRGRDSGIQR
jgi:integrase/recombinase XerD